MESGSSDDDIALNIVRSGPSRAQTSVELRTTGIVSDTHDNEYNIDKHYDSSVGSLRDFIVDDTESCSEKSKSDIDGYSSPISPCRPGTSCAELPDLARLSISKKPPPSTHNGDKFDRDESARRIFHELNQRVFGGKLSNVKIEWSKRLLTTAGQAKCKRFVPILRHALG